VLSISLEFRVVKQEIHFCHHYQRNVSDHHIEGTIRKIRNMQNSVYEC
jgi:hypothetical protein